MLTLGDLRKRTKSLPDDTPVVTAGFDESGVADAQVSTIRARRVREDMGHTFAQWSTPYEDRMLPQSEGYRIVVMVDHNSFTESGAID